MSDVHDHFDRLADLFLTDADGNRRPPAPAGNTTELLLVGHLPVRAGLWLTQYAQSVAADAGPTALLRLDTEDHVLEILGANESAARISAATTLRDALQMARTTVDRWLVRPSLASTREEWLGVEFDRITLLSGVDEAAVVAAYREIKELDAAAHSLGCELPPIGLVMVGADSERAGEASAKIISTASLHLNVDVALARCIPQMGSLAATLHLRYPIEEPIALDDVWGWIRSAPTTPPLARDAEGEPGSDAGSDPAVDDGDARWLDPEDEVVDAHEIPEIAGPESGAFGGDELTGDHASDWRELEELEEADTFPADLPQAVGDPPPGEEPRERLRLRPKLRELVEPKQPSVSAETGTVITTPRPVPVQESALASWIEGVTALGVKCPVSDRVQLAADDDGRLHLLAREEDLRELRVVASWAKQHAELLSLACREHLIDPAGDVVIDVVTETPARLADLHGTGLRLHVLAPVEVEGRAGWYCAPLND